MSDRENIFLPIVFLTVLIMLSTEVKAQKSLINTRPNIVLIMADDIGAYAFGCYGNPKAFNTPNIDKLAKTGVQFQTAYATSLCTPSRAMIMTGKYATRTGVWGNWWRWNDHSIPFYKHENFFQLLGKEGYTVVVAGKADGERMFGKNWGNWKKMKLPDTNESLIWPRDTRFVPESKEYKGETSDYAAGNHLDASRYWQPLLLKNGAYLPTTKEDYAPDMFCDFLNDFFKRKGNSKEPFFAYYSMVLPHGDAGMKNHQPPTPHVNKNMFEYVDVAVGKIIDGLERNGLRENTVVIFTSDNGSGGRPRGKNTSCEPAFLVPFIVNWPGKIQARGLVDEMVSLADVFPTLAALSGAKIEQEIDGISFIPVLEGLSGIRDHLFSYVAGERIIRDKNWLLESIHESSEATLWDCNNSKIAQAGSDNPNNFYKNLTNSNAPVVVKARERLDKILEKYPAPIGVPFSWEARRDSTYKWVKEKRIKNNN